jgi:CubicO group peptidase (beta-lactamase class C family)
MKLRHKFLTCSLLISALNTSAAWALRLDENRANTVLATATLSQEQFSAKLNLFMQELYTEFNIQSGSAIAIVKDDHLLYQQNFGFADIKQQQKVGDETLFYIASSTKPLFALALLQELRKSTLNLDSSLASLFPKIQFSSAIQADKVSMTNLLNHTSGIAENGLEAALAYSGDYTPATLTQFLSAKEVNEESPLTHFAYSNLGYNILSLAFEQNFQHSWQTSMIKNVLEPISMTHTSPFISVNGEPIAGLAKPYSFFNDSIETPLYLQKENNTMHAAGGLVSTSQDMAKLLLVELNQGRLDGQQVIPAELIARSQQITTVVDDKKGDFVRSGYALGWYTGEYKSELTYHHFGRFDGYRPHLSFMPAKKLGLVILNNEGDLNDMLTDIIADFAYSTLLDEADTDIRIKQRITDLKTMAGKVREKIVSKENNYLSMPLQLTLQHFAYTGQYKHALMGQIDIQQNSDGAFTFSWGNLHSVATALGKEDMLRVKAIPTHPEVLAFDINDGQVTSLQYGGFEFSKL